MRDLLFRELKQGDLIINFKNKHVGFIRSSIQKGGKIKYDYLCTLDGWDVMERDNPNRDERLDLENNLTDEEYDNLSLTCDVGVESKSVFPNFIIKVSLEDALEYLRNIYPPEGEYERSFEILSQKLYEICNA